MQYDVAVVGAGLAGLAAARELKSLGLSAVVVEGRDRLGGRTWTDDRLGRKLEMGGTWVHWTQPHIWSEINRYGLEVVRSPAPVVSHWVAGNKRYSGSPEQLWSLIGTGVAKVVEDWREWFPRPYQPLFSPALDQADRQTVQEKIDAMALAPDVHELVTGMWASNFNGYPRRGATTQAARWLALCGGDLNLLWEALVAFKLRHGTRSLVEALRKDSNADYRLSTAVGAIRHDGKGVEIRTEGGEGISARAAIVTASIHALPHIDIDPPLPADFRAMLDRGQASSGIKVWARVRGSFKPFFLLAGEHHPLVSVMYEYDEGGTSMLVGFGPDASLLDLNDRAAVQEVLRYWLPDIEVLESTGQSWAEDRFSRMTYAMLAPGQLTRSIKANQAPHGRLVVAGSDYANGWAGFMDGAIESGIRAARKMPSLLAAQS